MEIPSEPRPQCPECGSVLHPEQTIIVVTDGDEYGDIVPDSISCHPEPCDVFSGLYCDGDCIIDAIARGWPEYRAMTGGHELP